MVRMGKGNNISKIKENWSNVQSYLPLDTEKVLRIMYILYHLWVGTGPVVMVGRHRVPGSSG